MTCHGSCDTGAASYCRLPERVDSRYASVDNKLVWCSETTWLLLATLESLLGEAEQASTSAVAGGVLPPPRAEASPPFAPWRSGTIRDPRIPSRHVRDQRLAAHYPPPSAGRASAARRLHDIETPSTGERSSTLGAFGRIRREFRLRASPRRLTSKGSMLSRRAPSSCLAQRQRIPSSLAQRFGLASQPCHRHPSRRSLSRESLPSLVKDYSWSATPKPPARDAELSLQPSPRSCRHSSPFSSCPDEIAPFHFLLVLPGGWPPHVGAGPLPPSIAADHLAKAVDSGLRTRRQVLIQSDLSDPRCTTPSPTPCVAARGRRQFRVAARCIAHFKRHA